MRKIFHPSSPHALSTGASLGVSRVSLDSQNLGSAGQNYGFFAYLMDLQSKELHPSAPPPPPPEAPATQINDNGIPQPGTYVNGIKIGESFEVALFLVGMLGLFAIALLACFILSWAGPPRSHDFSSHVQQGSPVQQTAPSTVPLPHFYPNGQYVAMEPQLLQPPSIREQQAAIVQQAMRQHAMMQHHAAMQQIGMQTQSGMQAQTGLHQQAMIQPQPTMHLSPAMQSQAPMAQHSATVQNMHGNAHAGMNYSGMHNTWTHLQQGVAIDPATGRAR